MSQFAKHYAIYMSDLVYKVYPAFLFFSRSLPDFTHFQYSSLLPRVRMIFLLLGGRSAAVAAA